MFCDRGGDPGSECCCVRARRSSSIWVWNVSTLLWPGRDGPAQRCMHACQMVSAPAQVHPLSTVCTPAKLYANPLKRPAQHCTHACQMVSALAQVHPLSTVCTPARWYARPLKCASSALRAHLLLGKHSRSSAQHWMISEQLTSSSDSVKCQRS